MCELFAMSSKYPTDVDNYLSLLMPRGGDTGPHADGWGVAYYEGHASRVFKDAAPVAEGRYMRMLSKAGLKSTSVIAHTRLHVLEQKQDSHARQNSHVLLATVPLTKDNWHAIDPGSLCIYGAGKTIAALHT